MPKEILDVVDTAVKIGLGALIASMGTHLLAARNHKSEIKKAFNEEQRAIIKEIATTLEEVESQFNESFDAFQHNDYDSARKILVPTSRNAYSMRALANILDDDELVNTIDEIAKIIEDIYEETVGNDPKSICKLNELGVLLTNAKKESYPSIRKIYRATFA
jgi:hypothetical protein